MYGEYTTIEYDHREKDAEIIEDLEMEFDYTMKKRVLNIFDYTQKDAGIERKSVADFIGSYKKNEEGQTSLWDQCNRMVSQDEIKPYLVIVGEERHVGEYYNKRKMRIDLEGYYGALGSVAARYGFPVITVPNSFRFANVVAKIFHSHRHGKAGQLRQLSVTSASKYSAVEKILALVPGINQQATLIVEKLEVTVPRDIWTLTEKQLVSVDGIGPKKAEAIIDYLGI